MLRAEKSFFKNKKIIPGDSVYRSIYKFSDQKDIFNLVKICYRQTFLDHQIQGKIAFGSASPPLGWLNTHTSIESSQITRIRSCP